MKVPVTFGQYVPVDSPVHSLDAKAKMGLVAAFTAALFLVDGPLGMVAAAAVVAAAVVLSRVPWRIALRGIRAVVMILMITLAAHALRWNPATVALVRVGPLAVDAAGLKEGLFFVVRIVLLVVGTSLLTLTTSPVALTDGLERIMRPLARVRFPASEVAMMLTIALRFIPTTAQEAEKLIVAQTARGARFDAGGPIARARAYAPVLVPLFVNLFRRADDLATAMEARCYRGGVGRTRLHESRMRPRDWAVLCLGTLVLALVGITL
ncbi:MAG: cobalt/nickel transport system permease [Actinobacteria bacterium]|nr:MAG: cobalt/nickel transport system permease [Actinomycetota bacterium]MDO8949029.1 energy-coupling factor transporter transmembrane component T [Actinomycetota bacterium]